MLSVIILSVMAPASSHPFEQIPARGTSRYNIHVFKKFYITGPWKDLNVVMLSVILLSVVTPASSLPFEQIPARGTGWYNNIYACKKFYISSPWQDLNVIMLSVIILSVMAPASSLPFEQIHTRGTGRYDNIYICKKFYITAPWIGSECHYAEWSFCWVSWHVVAPDRSLPFQQIPAKGSSRINIYVRKKFYITGPWKGSECRNAEGHYADCRGAG